MISTAWNSFIYLPFYNVFIGIIGLIPGHSVGFGIIILTILVKIALFPLTKKSSLAQQKMKEVDPELREIKERFKDDKQEQAKRTLEIYQKHKINPFSGCLPILIQLPLIIGLYTLFMKGLTIKPEVLYSFVPLPSSLNMDFLGITLSSKSVLLAGLSGVTQFAQALQMLKKSPPPPALKEGEKPSLQDELARSMNIQMKYFFPIMITVVSYTTSAAVALYFVTSNILGIVQEYMIRRMHTPTK